MRACEGITDGNDSPGWRFDVFVASWPLDLLSFVGNCVQF